MKNKVKDLIIKELKKVGTFCEGREWCKEKVLKRNPGYLGTIFGKHIFIGELK